MTRLFFGIALPATVRDALAATQRQLQEAGVAAGNWSAPTLFHVTVLFLGELPDSARAALGDVGTSAANKVQPFTLTLSEIGVFERNGILWAGLADDGGMGSLRALHQATAALMAQTGMVKLEDRPYRAHITLARKLAAASWRQADTGTLGAAVASISFDVTSLCLFESKRENGRLVYPVVQSYMLGGEGAHS